MERFDERIYSVLCTIERRLREIQKRQIGDSAVLVTIMSQQHVFHSTDVDAAPGLLADTKKVISELKEEEKNV